MLDVLESVRRVVYRYAKTATPLAAEAAYGDTILEVESSIRFKKGDDIALHNGVEVEYFVIESIPDETHIVIPSPGINSANPWALSETPVIERCIVPGMFVQGIYIGEPNVIAKYPAITIMGNERTSDWTALNITEENYRIQIAIYVEDGTNEDGYYGLLKITNTIQKGLKKNIFPLVGEIETSNVIFDIAPNDSFVKIADTSQFNVDDKIVLEDRFKAEEMRIRQVIDSQTICVFVPPKEPYLVANDAKVIRLSRFIHNSWPESINYGYIHKETLLKAATISWFAKEIEVQAGGGWSDPQLS
jgi:hypothetical protein